MTVKLIATTLLAVATIAGQQPSPFYARAIYTKWKPGLRAEGQAFLKGAPTQATLTWLKAEPSAVGQIIMSRVLPGGGEIPYDRLRLVIMKDPPDLSGARQMGAHLQGTGMSPADYNAKLGSLMDTIKTEVWRSVYRLGSIKEGDYVAVHMSKPPAGKNAANLRYLREWEMAMRAEVIKSGRTTGMDAWELRFTASESPYSFVSLVAFPDSDSVYKGYGVRHEAFARAHPGKDYHEYRELGEAVEHSVQTVIYRVDSALWK